MPIETRDRRRYAAELKFLVSPAVGDDIRAWARVHLTADSHGTGPHGDGYVTTSLYTDTPALDVYRRRGSYGRSKYRVRRYGSSDVAFLERKLRTSSLVSKRRSIVPTADLARLIPPLADRVTWPGGWFAARLSARQLEPVCQVSYQRTARVTPTPYGLARLTVDTALRARPVDGWAFASPDYLPVLADQAIVELKFAVGMPALFKRLLETFGLAPITTSKYRRSMQALGLASVPDAAEVA
jgi:hypothetical protein